MMYATFTRISRLLTPSQRKSAVVLLGMMVVGLVVDIAGISLVIPVMVLMMQADVGTRYPVLAPALAQLGNPGQHALIIAAVLALVVLYGAKNLYLAFLAWWETRFAYDVQARLAQRLFANYLRQPYAFHLRRNSAGLVHIITGEVSMLVHQAIAPGMIVLTEALTLLGIGTLVFLLEPAAAAAVGGVLGLASWGFHRATRARIKAWGQDYQHHEGLRMQHLMQGLGGVKEVRLLGREEDFLARFDVHNTQCARMERSLETLQKFPRLWLEVLAVTGLAVLVLTMLAQGREMERIVPAVALFAAAAFRLMPSMGRMLRSAQSVRYSLPVITTLSEEVRLAACAPARQPGVPPARFQRDIRVAGIHFAYPQSQDDTLRDVSMLLRSGETVGLIGPSGSGKSTLVDILLGLLVPAQGQVRVDGQDIQQDLRGWQDQIGYVAQSIYLTDDTIRRNVAFGLPDERIDDAAVTRAIKAAQLEEFIAGQPEGLDTLVGERGVRLSGGQRQRIGIARALYHDPPVLVLDEATSSLDTQAERGVMQAVAHLHHSKTILIVAHRLTTVEQCDRIYRLEHGRIVAQGEPAQILHVAA
jgi:ATP-binding cassette, subfamily B, bacterial PglK